MLAALLLMPAAAFAGRGGGGHRHHGHSDAVAWGIVGGIVGGVILDRVLFPPAVVVAPPVYAPYGYGGNYTRRTYERYRSAPPPCRSYGRRGGYRY